MILMIELLQVDLNQVIQLDDAHAVEVLEQEEQLDLVEFP